MKYIVTEEELRKWIERYSVYNWKESGQYVLKGIIKSKKPVEEIASGHIEEYEKQYGIYNVNNDTWFDLDEWFSEIKKKLGKSIKIYVEVGD